MVRSLVGECGGGEAAGRLLKFVSGSYKAVCGACFNLDMDVMIGCHSVAAEDRACKSTSCYGAPCLTLESRFIL